MSVFFALLSRELRDLGKNPARFLLRTVLQPLLFIVVFSYVLPTVARGASSASAALSGQGGRSFTLVLGPGLIAVAMVYQGIQAVTVPLMTELTFTGELEDRLQRGAARGPRTAAAAPADLGDRRRLCRRPGRADADRHPAVRTALPDLTVSLPDIARTASARARLCPAP